MVSTMITRNAGRHTTATQGGGQVNRMVEGERSGDQAGSGTNGQGSGRGGGGGVPDFATIIAQQLQNLLPTIGNVRSMKNKRGGCSYKEFMACNPKDYDEKGGVIVDEHLVAFGGNTCDLGSFGEETDKTKDLHQISFRIVHTTRGDGIAGIKRRHRDLSSDGVRKMTTVSGRNRLKSDIEDSIS
ncbi:hypothetical protein Tco_1095411 [Tanacetum coccineum]